jgi:hypothetical protein
MKSNLPAIVLLMCFATFATSNAQVKKEEYWEPIESSRILVDSSDPEVRTLLFRWDEIGAGLSTTTNPSAGTYEKSGYRGYFLRWSPEMGFIYVYHSEGLSIIDFSYGKVSVTADSIVFSPERTMREEFSGVKLKMPSTWIPITVDKRRFFVAEQEIRDFGDYFGGYNQYNDFNGPCCEFSPFFVKTESDTLERRPIRGTFISSAYRRFVREPIEARIILIGRKKLVRDYGLEGKLYGNLFQKASLLSVSISAGSRAGVKKNMLFRLVGEPHGQYLRITRVGEGTASGVVIRDVDDDGRETYYVDIAGTREPEKKDYPPIRVGTKVTTSPILDF